MTDDPRLALAALLRPPADPRPPRDPALTAAIMSAVRRLPSHAELRRARRGRIALVGLAVLAALALTLTVDPERLLAGEWLPSFEPALPALDPSLALEALVAMAVPIALIALRGRMRHAD